MTDTSKNDRQVRIDEDVVPTGAKRGRAYRMKMARASALQVLEDDSAADAWLRRPNRSLGGKTPLDMLATQAGYERVLDTLQRIAYGVVS